MLESLHVLLLSKINEHDLGLDPHFSFCKNFFQKIPNDTKKMDDTLALWSKYKISNAIDFLSFLRKIFALTIVSKKAELLHQANFLNILEKIKSRLIIESHQNCRALANLIFMILDHPLCEMKCDILPSGFALSFESISQIDDRGDELALSFELAAIWLILGMHKNNKQWIEKALRMLRFSLQCIDANLHPFSSLWTKENQTDGIESLIFLYQMLFSCFKHYYSDIVEKIGNSIYQKIKQLLEKKSFSILIYPSLFCYWIDKLPLKKKESLSFSFSINDAFVDPFSSLCSYRSKTISSAFTLFGRNTGLGSIHTRDIYIKTFGPQFFPLGSQNNFGISQPLHKYRLNDKRFSQKITDKMAKMKGWVQFRANTGNEACDSYWMKFFCQTQKGFCNLHLEMLKNVLKRELAISFYVSANKCFLNNGQSFFPATMKQYDGPLQNIILQSPFSQLTLEAKGASKMHIIPLSKNSNYWQSDFLIAFELIKHDPKLSVAFSSKEFF